tara:strand:- start:2163 stop:2813 length:651 start_codon:yes stop_codon:yes gene_type:complete
MAIDPNWVRENPEEAARQMDVLGDMHVDHVRHLWESRGFGGCVEFAEAFDALVQQKKLLSDTCNMAADLVDDIEQLTRERDQYRAAEETQIALRQKTQARVESSVPKWKFESLVEQCRITEEQRDEARRRLALLNEDGAWHWMNDGNDHLESLSCLVLINAAELRSLIAEKQCVAVEDFAKTVWEELLKSYKNIKVMPLTMARRWVESKRAFNDEK